MISAAAHVPIHFIHPEQPGEAVFPPVSLICEFTKAVAACAVKQGLNRIPVTDVKKAVEDVMWDAEYTK
jgi:malate dehydrogenase (oxaloacetate-decarboxylating)